MNMKQFPVIDPIATGKNIIRLRAERGMSVRDLQAYFGFEEPQAIYKWQQGKSLPSVDNLYALGALFEVPMEDILVSRTSQLNLIICEQQAVACCSPLFMGELLRLSRIRQRAKIASTIFISDIKNPCARWLHEAADRTIFAKPCLDIACLDVLTAQRPAVSR